MFRYILSRLFTAAFVVWATFTVTFMLLYAMPGDAVSIQNSLHGSEGGGALTSAAAEQARARYGLDQPLHIQYASVIASYFRGDPGMSMVSGNAVISTLSTALPDTMKLAGWAFVLAVLLGGATAFLTTFTRLKPLRNLLMMLPSVGVAMPTFWIGIILLQVFAFGLGWFPAMGNEGLVSLVLPAITLAVPSAAIFAQVLTRSLLDTLDQPFIQTARAKGVRRLSLHWSHALRNAILPVLTLAGISIGHMLGGAVITETVFTRQGLGRVMQSAVAMQDTPLVLAITVFCAGVIATVNLAVDLAYPVIDPRVGQATAIWRAR